MKIVLASDSYKGCLSSKEVALAARKAVLDLYPDCETAVVPVADGGEGTVDAIVDGLSGRREYAVVSDPLGRPVRAEYGIAGDLAIIECASACGLTLLSKDERNPLLTSTRGLGELILDAIDKGCRRFLVGLGGSATNDGGKGMVEVPGLLEKARGLDFTVACDVDTPFIGPDGTSRNFGPQKGASPEVVEILENRLTEYAAEILEKTGVDVRYMKGAGAAGGLGGAFRAFFGAELKRGVEMVLDIIGFDSQIEGADLVITGEGRSDFQTVRGKTASGVLEHARAKGIPVALVSGAISDEDVLRKGGFSRMKAVTPANMPLSLAMQPEIAKKNIYEAISGLLKEL